MSRSPWTMAGLCVLLFAAAAFAQDMGSDWTLNGFVDASYFLDANTSSSTFGLDQVEVDIIRETDQGIVLRTDLETQGDQIGDVEQGFLLYRPAFINGLDILFGKFNAPMGFEALDAPDMYQYSHSLLFNQLPTNFTGLELGYSINETMSILAWVTNGWDVNYDNNEVRSFGGRTNASFGALSLGLSGVTGLEDNDQLFPTSLADLDLSFTGMENLLIGGELLYGKRSSRSVSSNKTEWKGAMVMGNYQVNEWLAATLRFDMLTTRITGTDASQNSITFAPLFTLGDGMGALIEYRLFNSDRDIYSDSNGNPTGMSQQIAFEMTYTF